MTSGVMYGRLLDVARVDDVMDGSRWYLDPDDQETRYQSVTWTCGASESAPWLVDWAGKITAEWVIDNLDAVLAFLYDPEYGPAQAIAVIKMEGRRQRELAADVGVWLHDVFEALVLDHPVPDPPSNLLGRRLDGEILTQELLDGWATGLLNFMTDFAVDAFLAEATVCNPVEGYAGTLDAGARLRDLGSWLLDLKTGKHLPGWLDLQIQGYWDATELWLPLGERCPLPAFDRAGALHLRPTYHRGYKLREITPCASTRAEFRRRTESLRWREQKITRPVVYPLLEDGSQPLPMIEDLPLRTRSALIRQGLVLLAELCEFTPKDLLGVKGFGKESVPRVRELLADYGLALRGEDLVEVA